MGRRGVHGDAVTLVEAIQWLRDVAECDPSHPRAPFYREAAADLEERCGARLRRAPSWLVDSDSRRIEDQGRGRCSRD